MPFSCNQKPLRHSPAMASKKKRSNGIPLPLFIVKIFVGALRLSEETAFLLLYIGWLHCFVLLLKILPVPCGKPSIKVRFGDQHEFGKSFKRHSDCDMVLRRFSKLWNDQSCLIGFSRTAFCNEQKIRRFAADDLKRP